MEGINATGAGVIREIGLGTAEERASTSPALGGGSGRVLGDSG